MIARCRAAKLRLLHSTIEANTERALRPLPQAIMGAPGNRYFLDTVHCINRIRRLLSYRSMIDRTRYPQQ